VIDLSLHKFFNGHLVAVLELAEVKLCRPLGNQRLREFRRWFASIGRAGIGKALVKDGTKFGAHKTLLHSVGVDAAKEDLFTSFRVYEPGPSYCHFSSALSGEYFLQLTSEKLVKTTKDYVTTTQWVKTRERNEALDCFVYAHAAQSVLKPDFCMIRKNLLEYAAEIARVPEPEEVILSAKPEPAPEATPKAKPASTPGDRDRTEDGRPRPQALHRRPSSGFVNGWR
jgi:phage terminase large subunit GpA-like protein